MASTPPRPPAALLLGAFALACMLAGGCATTSDAADAQRRRELVLVPPDSQAVDSVRWSRVRSIEPLNNRMILIAADRPYLLVLARSCRGLQPNSVVVSENIGNTFQPRVDTLMFVDPFSDAAFTSGVGTLDRIGGISPSVRSNSGVARGAVVCQPETLYALDSKEAVEEIRQSLSRKRKG